MNLCQDGVVEDPPLVVVEEAAPILPIPHLNLPRPASSKPDVRLQEHDKALFLGRSNCLSYGLVGFRAQTGRGSERDGLIRDRHECVGEHRDTVGAQLH